MEMENEDTTLKKGRHRKKQLFNSILQQMEFYFSDANISKDRYLSQLIQEEPYVDLNHFLKFNKIRKLTNNVDDLRKALTKSKNLELSEDLQKIKRKTEVKIKENIDDCTIYVERISADCNHEFLSSIFSDFGTVAYVSIPKYKHNHVNKGFAFIEFDNEKEAQSAVSYFENIGCKMSSNIKPEDLCSISSFVKENQLKVEVEEDEINNQKRKRSIDENVCNKKVKTEDGKQVKENQIKVEEGDEINNQKGKRSIDEDISNKKVKTEDDKQVIEVTQTDEGEGKKKKKKEHKKKNLIKELGLKVLSKQEWKKMRNAYLNLQRKKMKEVKIQINKSKLSKHSAQVKNIHEGNCNSIKTQDSEDTEVKLSKLEYIPGTIVKIKLLEPCLSDKKIKIEIKAAAKDIKYIDVPFSSGNEVLVRFLTSDAAQKFCNEESIGSKCLLEGEEEKEYWQKIETDRLNKFQKSKKKQRGKDKLMKKIEKHLAKHTRFDETE